MKKRKTAGYHCYNLIGNLMGKMPYDDLLNKKHKISKDVLTKLTNIPFYISLKTQLRQSCHSWVAHSRNQMKLHETFLI